MKIPFWCILYPPFHTNTYIYIQTRAHTKRAKEKETSPNNIAASQILHLL